MGDETVSEPEMGNQHGSGKKKKNASGISNGKERGELSDDDLDYKYVSIVDVNPPSQYVSASEESLTQTIEVNSPDKVNGDGLKLNGSNGEIRNPNNGDVLKCSVIIGEPPLENGHQKVSRVSLNGDFDDPMGEVPDGSFTEQVPNGSSSFIESLPHSSSVVEAINGSFHQAVPVGSPSPIHRHVELPSEEINGSCFSSTEEFSNGYHSPAGIPNGHSSPISYSTLNGSVFETPNGISPTNVPVCHLFPPDVDQIANGSLVELVKNGNTVHEDSVDERLSLAVLQTLETQGMDLGDGPEDEAERVVREKLKRQRSGSSDLWNHEDTDDHCIVDFLDKINDHAEARLAAKRQARAEAREIRMRELERMQRETEDGDKVYDIYNTPEAVNRCVRAGSVATPRSLLSSNNSYHSSRRSSEDSLEEGNSLRDIRHELKELEDKFRKAMIANAQLDNEKAAFAYEADLLKDRYEELEEENLQLAREHKETSRQLEHTRRHRTKLMEDLEISQRQLGELLQLIQEKGLVVVEGDCSSSEEESESGQPRPKKPPKKALVSAEVADVLQQGSGSLDVRLKKFVEERNELMDELRRVKLELEEERASRGRHANGPTDSDEDIQREATKQLGDYKFKLQKAEQDVSTLQTNVARLESQVIRFKSAAESSEKLEDELKSEKRKLQRELREAQARVEELETSHSHLQRRLDKLKTAKSTLLKDL